MKAPHSNEVSFGIVMAMNIRYWSIPEIFAESQQFEFLAF